MINEYAYFVMCKNCGRAANIEIKNIEAGKLTKDLVCSCCNKIVRKQNEKVQPKI